MTDRVDLAGQIAEVRRELALRRSVYPRLVGSGKMRQGEADLSLRRMEAVLATLQWLETHQRDIRVLLAEQLGRDA